MPDLCPLDFLRDVPDDGSSGLAKTSALIILNCPIPDIDLVKRLWYHTTYRIAADGGANRLYDLLNRSEHNIKDYLPSEIHGDLDSLRSDVRSYYASCGVPVTLDADQYSTDFGKSINRATAHLSSIRESDTSPVNIVVLGSLAGRVDQGIGLLSELYREHKRSSARVRFWLFSEGSVSFMLGAGINKVDVSNRGDLITENVGVLPLFGPTTISLTGFEWDVKDWATEMGGQVSTSNHIRADELVISAEHPVFFTVERRTPSS